MATLRFTSTLVRHRPAPTLATGGETLRAALDNALADDALLKAYILDEQGRVRKTREHFLSMGR